MSCSAEAELRRRLELLRDNLGKINCARCAGGPDLICRGEPKHDDPIVAKKPGQCLSPINQIAYLLVEATAHAYKSVASEVPEMPS